LEEVAPSILDCVGVDLISWKSAKKEQWRRSSSIGSSGSGKKLIIVKKVAGIAKKGQKKREKGKK